MKVYMVSLGCNKNKVDSEMILGAIKNDCELTDDCKSADLIIVNTCAFIEPARKEAIDNILEVSDYKKKNAKLIVCGCLPQRYKGQLEELLPEVDRFISIDEYDNISKIISDALKSNYEISGEFSPLNRIY